MYEFPITQPQTTYPHKKQQHRTLSAWDQMGLGCPVLVVIADADDESRKWWIVAASTGMMGYWSWPCRLRWCVHPRCRDELGRSGGLSGVDAPERRWDGRL